MLAARSGFPAADTIQLPRGPLPVHKAGGLVPLGEDAGAVPPGTERVEHAMGAVGIGLALLLTVCAILIAVRGRRR